MTEQKRNASNKNKNLKKKLNQKKRKKRQKKTCSTRSKVYFGGASNYLHDLGDDGATV